jgi:peptidoglycan/LPS O-acetylase OafA/YrhL
MLRVGRRRRAAAPLLGDVTGGRARGMDVLRLSAATLVIVAHSYALTNNLEPLQRFGGPEFGDIAVAVFFAISGFLVTASWASDPRLRSFLLRRALRILPGLWVVLLLTTFVVGLLVTDLAVTQYLTSVSTWRYPLERAIVFSTRPDLPGVFATNPYGTAVNGSLWTLPVEVTAYGATLILGVTGLLARRRGYVLAATIALFVVQETLLRTTVSLAVTSPGSILHWLVHFGLFYAVGALLFLYRERIPLSFAAAAAALVLWLLSFDTAVLTVVGQVALPYAVLVLGYRAPAAVDRVMRRIGDLSYGTYIYAFPVQQTIVHYDTGISPFALIATTIPITYGCAFLSWRVVEQPALRLRRRLTREPDGAPRAAVVPPASPHAAVPPAPAHAVDRTTG